ncbi:MAG: hypothetical protein IT186_16910 [Acidobacteria bacterium]|nr:hypothetical protein [Acidobacteriota bacterium]MCG3194500.1 hypothetical protein [Thermoanaerobaculia bacterium]MCK6685147.1 hypothetical protein [Thermoanaerobaculia bacterium]
MSLDRQLQRIIDALIAEGIPLEIARKEFEKKYVATAVSMADGNMGRAARSLGIHRNTLRMKISLLNIPAPKRGRDHT